MGKKKTGAVAMQAQPATRRQAPRPTAHPSLTPIGKERAMIGPTLSAAYGEHIRVHLKIPVDEAEANARLDAVLRTRFEMATAQHRRQVMARPYDPSATPRMDHGCRGEAQKGRASDLVETIEAGVKQRQMHDDEPIAHYRRTALLGRRECDALQDLAETYQRSGRLGATTGGYGQRVGGVSTMSDEQAAAFVRYSRLLMLAPAETRHALAQVAAREWPTVPRPIETLKRGARVIADHLRLPAD